MVMVEKKADRAAKRVKGLRAKGMSAKQANRVKGGVIAIIAPSSNQPGQDATAPMQSWWCKK